jgi:hypothetical protein
VGRRGAINLAFSACVGQILTALYTQCLQILQQQADSRRRVKRLSCGHSIQP